MSEDVGPAASRSVETVADGLRQRREARREANKLPTKGEQLAEQADIVTEGVAAAIEAHKIADEPPITIEPEDTAVEDTAIEGSPVEAQEAAEAAPVDPVEVLLGQQPPEVPFSKWTEEAKLEWAKQNAERYQWAYNYVAPLSHEDFERDLAQAMQVSPARAFDMYASRYVQTQELMNQFQHVQHVKQNMRAASWHGFLSAISIAAPDLAQVPVAVAEAALKPYASMFKGDQWEQMLLGFKGNKPAWDIMVRKAADELRASYTPAQTPAREPVKVKAQPIPRDDSDMPPHKIESLSQAVRQRRAQRRAQNAEAARRN